MVENAYEFVSQEEQAKSLMVGIYTLERQLFALKMQQEAVEAQIATHRDALVQLPVIEFDPAQATGEARRAQMEAQRAARRNG